MTTLLNMYQWNEHIFDNIDIPTEFDKDELIMVIMHHCELCTLIYTNPVLFQYKIEMWFRYKKTIFQKLWETMNYEYNPIENYDRKEEYIKDNVDSSGNIHTAQRKNTLDKDYENKVDFTEGHTGTDNTTTTLNGKVLHHIDETETLSTSAFNEKGWQNKDKTKKDGDNADTTENMIETKNRTLNLTDTNKGGENGNENDFTVDVDNSTLQEFRNGAEKFKTRAHGNIGVTTTQQMIEQERNIVKFHVYDYIAREFETSFCLLLY